MSVKKIKVPLSKGQLSSSTPGGTHARWRKPSRPAVHGLRGLLVFEVWNPPSPSPRDAALAKTGPVAPWSSGPSCQV